MTTPEPLTAEEIEGIRRYDYSGGTPGEDRYLVERLLATLDATLAAAARPSDDLTAFVLGEDAVMTTVDGTYREMFLKGTTVFARLEPGEGLSR